MKNLAAAAKALKRTGPATDWLVKMEMQIRVLAHDEEEAIEKANEDFSNGTMAVVPSSKRTIEVKSLNEF